jgi:hypothetical protein
VDGKPGGPIAARPVQAVAATIGGVNAPVQYAGGVFGLTAGGNAGKRAGAPRGESRRLRPFRAEYWFEYFPGGVHNCHPVAEVTARAGDAALTEGRMPGYRDGITS